MYQSTVNPLLRCIIQLLPSPAQMKVSGPGIEPKGNVSGASTHLSVTNCNDPSLLKVEVIDWQYRVSGECVVSGCF